MNNCPKVAPLCIDTTDIKVDIPDDNQFFLDARTILGEICNKMYPKNINKTSLQLKSDIREAIRYEVLRDRFTVEANKKKSIKEFANDLINHNIKCDQKNALVIAYNKIIQEEQKKKKEYVEKRKKETKSLDEIKLYRSNKKDMQTGGRNMSFSNVNISPKGRALAKTFTVLISRAKN